MVNAWSLAHSILNETLDEDYPIMTDDKNRITPQESDEYDPIGGGNTATEPEHSPSYYDYTRNDPDAKNPFTDAFDYAMAEAVVSGAGIDEYPYDQNFLADNDDNAAHHFTNVDMRSFAYENFDLTNEYVNYDELNLNIHANSPYNSGWERLEAQEELDKKMEEKSSIKDPSNRKYKEDESIKALQDYIATTYGGHYTSEQNNVQTLDLIESVGDAEAFCRSNAIKYLSRYDKKGQANRDILKALHYSLLLYHFSGQTNETPTRGYETF